MYTQKGGGSNSKLSFSSFYSSTRPGWPCASRSPAAWGRGSGGRGGRKGGRVGRVDE